MNEAIMLKSTDGRSSIPMAGIHIKGELHDMMAEVSVEQIYKNQEKKTIECVYSFPLPHRAVLMDFSVVIDGRVLNGHVVKKSEANEQYEDALAEGNGAILLEKVSDADNIYTVNVGNLRSGETAVIHFSYAMLNHLQGDNLRISIPTTIAPRYGNPYRSGLMPHQIPETNLTVEHRYELEFRITGMFAHSGIVCPTHKVKSWSDGEDTLIKIQSGLAELDRDFVLNLRPSEMVNSSVSIGKDFEGYSVLASFIPRLPKISGQPRDIRIVIDCSGSMNGTSITQAKSALSSILDALRPDDFFNITLFGSDHFILFGEQVIANKSNLAAARKLARNLNAEMGGTEIKSALVETCKLESPINRADILLVTDGEIWESEDILRTIEKTGHRVFSIGVGASASESFIRGIAERTGGIAEFVTPNEEMAEHIVRHFNRIYSPVGSPRIAWPEGLVQQTPSTLPVVYDGDTMHVFGHFNELPFGEVQLKIDIGDLTVTQKAKFSHDVILEEKNGMPSSLSRLAAHKVLIELSDDKKAEYAVRYQLMTDATSFIVIDEREVAEKTDGEPVLRKVPQMLAAGWGGVGVVKNSIMSCYSESMNLNADECLEIPSFLRRSDDIDIIPTKDLMEEFIEKLNDVFPVEYTLSTLQIIDVPTIVLSSMAALMKSGFDEREIVVEYLYRLIVGKWKNNISDINIQAIKYEHKLCHLPKSAIEIIKALVNITDNEINSPELIGKKKHVIRHNKIMVK